MAIQIIRNQVIDAIINEDKLDANAVAFAKIKSSDIETDLGLSASSSKIARADAIKSYIDAEVAGGKTSWKDSCIAATTSIISGSYNNGSSGVGATITATGNGAASFDGISLSSGQRVLVKDGCNGVTPNGAANGVYTVTTVGDAGNPFVLTRADDHNAGGEINGSIIPVIKGDDNSNRAFLLNGPSNGDPSIGTDAITAQQRSALGLVNAGAGVGKVADSTAGHDKIEVELQTNGGLKFNTAGDAGKIQIDLAASKAVQIVGSSLDFVIDGSTLSQGASGAKVADAGITATQLNTSVAGAGLSGGAGTALAVDVNELSEKAADAVAGDFIAIADSEDSNASKKISVTNLVDLMDGDGLAATSGVLAVDLATDPGLEFNSAKLRVKLDGATLSRGGSGMSVASVPNALTAGNGLTAGGTFDGAAARSFAVQAADASISVGGSGIAAAFAANSGLENSSGIQLKSALAGSGLSIAAAAGDQVLNLNVDNSTVEVNSDTLRIKDLGVATGKMADDAVTFAKLGITPQTEVFTGNGSTAAYTLSSRIDAAQIADFKKIVRAYRNGIRIEFVASGASGTDQYEISDNGSATVITLGANLDNGSKLIVDYFA